MWFHKHIWEEIQREQVEIGWLDYASGHKTYTGWVTRITFRCECQSYKQTELKGKVCKKG